MRFLLSERRRPVAATALPSPARQLKGGLSLGCLLVLQACALPRSGPMIRDVQAANHDARIALSPITPEIAAATRGAATASFPDEFRAAQPIDYERFAPGDGVDVVIWERDNLGLFSSSPSPGLSGGGGGGGGGNVGAPSPAGSSTATTAAAAGGSPSGVTGSGSSAGGIGPVGSSGGGGSDASDVGTFTVGRDGAIALPYVGTVHISGLTPAEARSALLQRLRRLVIATDVRVAPTAQRGSLVTIQGDNSKAGVYAIGQGMVRLNQLLSQAAPDQTNPEQTSVTISRGATSATVRLIDIYRDPSQDIALRPDDSIVVRAIQDYVTVIGAPGGQGRVRISRRNYSVLDAVADSRGLADASADPRGLFLLRANLSGATQTADRRPAVYQFDMRLPDQLLLAEQFAVRDGDIVFISDAPFTQVQKALSAFSATLGTARSVSALGQ